jgi:coenzyme F420-reducing hydrogenase alpha subunit
LQFIKEFKAILEKHNKLHWLSENKFVDIKEEDREAISHLGKTLIEIGEYQREVAKKIINYQKGIELLKEEDQSTKEEIYKGLVKIKSELDQSLYEEIRHLMQKYHALVYQNGLILGDNYKLEF